MDISDGLFGDMKKLINKQKYGFIIDLNKIPISNKLRLYIKNNKKNKLDFVDRGDDYQILFTSSKENRTYIKKLSKRINQKITLIGKITNHYKKYLIIKNDVVIKALNYDGYTHKF